MCTSPIFYNLFVFLFFFLWIFSNQILSFYFYSQSGARSFPVKKLLQVAFSFEGKGTPAGKMPVFYRPFQETFKKPPWRKVKQM